MKEEVEEQFRAPCLRLDEVPHTHRAWYACTPQNLKYYCRPATVAT
jgi:hypothetical protein